MKNDCQLSIICSKSQKESYKLAAKLSKLSMAQWIRTHLNVQALKTIQKNT